jgi:transposase
MPGTLASAAEHLATVDPAPMPEAAAEMIADEGYHSRDAVKGLDGGPWKSCVSEPKREEFSRWHGDDAARHAVYNNRARLLSGVVARQAFKFRGELVERSFALLLDRGGLRRVWRRGRENFHKRYLIHIAVYNLGFIMRLLTGAGTPRKFRMPAFVMVFAFLKPDTRRVRRHRQSIGSFRHLAEPRPFQLKAGFLDGLLSRGRGSHLGRLAAKPGPLIEEQSLADY